MLSSMGFSALVSRRPAIQVTGRLAVAPVGLPPTEHVRLLWTHTSSTITPESHSSRPRQGCTGRQARRAPRGGKDRGDSRSQWPASSLPPPRAVVRTAGRAHHHEHPSRRQLLALQLRRLTNNPAFPAAMERTPTSTRPDPTKPMTLRPQTSWKGRQGNRTRLWRRTCARKQS
jgi:hypothetical protein